MKKRFQAAALLLALLNAPLVMAAPAAAPTPAQLLQRMAKPGQSGSFEAVRKLTVRALIKPGWQAGEAAAAAPAHADWQALRRWRAQALGRNPWLDLVPACLNGVTPHLQIDRFWLRDAKGFSLPIWQGFGQGWRLLALSGGQPISLSLEFDGERVYPLGAWSEDPDEGRIYVPFAETEAA